jgi:hypothetical protein
LVAQENRLTERLNHLQGSLSVKSALRDKFSHPPAREEISSREANHNDQLNIIVHQCVAQRAQTDIDTINRTIDTINKKKTIITEEINDNLNKFRQTIHSLNLTQKYREFAEHSALNRITKILNPDLKKDLFERFITYCLHPTSELTPEETPLVATCINSTTELTKRETFIQIEALLKEIKNIRAREDTRAREDSIKSTKTKL